MPACAGAVPLFELPGVLPFALVFDLCPLVPLPELPPLAVFCEDVEDSVFAPASVASPPLLEPVLSSPHAPAATSANAAKPKRRVDLFMIIPVAWNCACGCDGMNAPRRDARL